MALTIFLIGHFYKYAELALEWVVNKADSWRISGDIADKFSSILKIIDLNAAL